jgi:hypothetical protein
MSWLQVWSMMKGGTKKGLVGQYRKWVMGEGYHEYQGNKGNAMG